MAETDAEGTWQQSASGWQTGEKVYLRRGAVDLFRVGYAEKVRVHAFQLQQAYFFV